MTVLSILETLLIGPLKLVFEFIFAYANKFVQHPGLAIVFLSLTMNILVLPLYMRADAMQAQARDIEARLHTGVAHIRKTFSGDERMMILQAYYRQNHYKPTDALNGSVSLLLEIPFFIAAYQFLSHLELLSGVSFGPIQDLSAPDGLLVIGGLRLNLLPFVMTGINLLSSSLYLKGFPAKTKVQLYAMALFFLVFLYASPSGLVFYWTLNNLFSLVKTVFYKLKKPGLVLRILGVVCGLPLCVYAVFFCPGLSVKLRVLLAVLGLLMAAPLPLSLWKRQAKPRQKASTHDRRFFLLGSVFLTVQIGLLIPSVVLAASPQEYVDVLHFSHPLWHLVSSFCMAAGTFLIWMRVFYWLATPRGKVLFEYGVWLLCGIALIDYMFFGTNLGILYPTLQYEASFSFTRTEQLVNLLILALAAAAMFICAWKWRKAAASLLLLSVLAQGGMAARNAATIKSSIDQLALPERDVVPEYTLSKEGRNVVVIMLDRALGPLIPYLFNEKPELAEQFDGFTYYSNTISFGGSTNFGAPPLFGGYEYTPVEMNRRPSERLVDKHNEALKLMPAIFSENGYEVTVCDLPYANYQWVPDLSIFDGMPGVHAYVTEGRFSDWELLDTGAEGTRRNFFCFSVMKSVPLFLQPSIYDFGRYHQLDPAEITGQTVESMSTASGLKQAFLDSYTVLENLSGMARVTEEKLNTFLALNNDTTHDLALLREPDYVPAEEVDNREYDETHSERFTVDGRSLRVENETAMTHYHSNMAAMLKLGEWFDWMRENGVYDNTRIILASDHGRGISMLDDLIVDKEGWRLNALSYYPLLMVKDFDSKGFTTSEKFMTNADVPTMAMEGLIDDPINPFTGKNVTNTEKTAHDQFLIVDGDWVLEDNNGYTYTPSIWASVHDDLRDPNNWTVYEGKHVLTEHAAP